MFDRQRYEPKRVILSSLRAMVRELDATALSGEDAVAMTRWFAEAERLVAAGKALCATRVAETDRWRQSGHRSSADWLAKETGTSVSEARAALDTAAKVLPGSAVDAAHRNGELSAKQAEAIAGAVAADPASEQRLLAMAAREPLGVLRDECARVRATADRDPKARRERIRRNRYWKCWSEPDGSRRGTYLLPPEEAAMLEAATQPFIDARLDQARRAGEREPSEAYAADGLVAMAASTAAPRADATPARAAEPSTGDRPARGGRGRRRMQHRRELFCIVNLESLRRGVLLPGEICEIPGVGPVSLDVVRELFGDALLRIIIRDGVDITTVVHAGRTASEVQETATFVRQDGRCGGPRCELPITEIDHRLDFADHGAASLDGLLGLCGHHHDLKTIFGHAWRREPGGGVTWVFPDGTEAACRPPPVTTGP